MYALLHIFHGSPVGEIGVSNLSFRFNTPDLKTLDLKPSTARDSEVHETPKALKAAHQVARLVS